jgi:hypothetical protein
MLSGTTGIADIFALLLWQMTWAIAEIALCLLLIVLASRLILRSIRQHQGHANMMPWLYDHIVHGHDPRPWLRRRSRRAVRIVAVSSARQMRRLDSIVRG